MLLALDNLTLTLGGKTLFTDVSLRLGDDDRIGLIGPNGSGKTSLLRLLTGELEADRGDQHRRHGLRVGYLPQDPIPQTDKSLLQLVRERIPGRSDLDAELESSERELADAEERSSDETKLVELAQRVADLHERSAHFEADYADHIALRILAGLGFQPGDAERDVGELSGGWQMRGVLASLLFMQPDLLLLDEPTNHLDMPSVAWFGSFLRRYRHAFVLISHDREFLNEQIDRVVSFEPEGIRSYAGNYDAYCKQRALEAEVLANRQRNLQKEREKTEQFINRFRYQATKAKAVQSRIKALERLDKIETLGRHSEVSFKFRPTKRTSRQALTVIGLYKSYGDNEVLRDVSVGAVRGERIAIVGLNGAGKTTLLKTVAGEVERDAGSVDFGHHVRLGYYAQHHAEMLDPESTVFDEVAQRSEEATPVQVRTLLGALLFSGDDVDKQIRVLSGGEKARVALARLLISPHNLLLMDEPTNHLDLASSDRLAEALTTYDGTLIFVSHNRAFVRRLATRIWNIQDGAVEIFPGTIDEYLASALRRFDVAGGEPSQATRQKAGEKKTSSAGRSAKERRRRQAEERTRRREVLAPLTNKVEELETVIAVMEETQRKRSAQLEDPDFYTSPDSADVLRAYQSDQARLERYTANWEKAALDLENASRDLDDTQ